MAKKTKTVPPVRPIINVSLPKLNRDQQKAALDAVDVHFKSLVDTLIAETAAEIGEVESQACDFFDGRDDTPQLDPAFNRHRQPILKEADKLEDAERKRLLDRVKQIRETHKVKTEIERERERFIEAHQAALDRARKEFAARIDKYEREQVSLQKEAESIIAAHNKTVQAEAAELVSKQRLAVARINAEKAAARLACLFNGDAQVIGSFLAALPAGSLVEQAAREAGLPIDDLKEKADQKLMLVG